jgi:dihydrofolate reductase
MTLSLIVAMTDERVIGRDNQLPWHLSDDLKRFKKITMGHPIIMGRKTFESIGKPLPGRQNIVVTNNKTYAAAGVTVAHDLCQALAACEQDKNERFVIGGAGLFQAALPMADKLYLHLVPYRQPLQPAPYPPIIIPPPHYLLILRPPENIPQILHTPRTYQSLLPHSCPNPLSTS